MSESPYSLPNPRWIHPSHAACAWPGSSPSKAWHSIAAATSKHKSSHRTKGKYFRALDIDQSYEVISVQIQTIYKNADRTDMETVRQITSPLCFWEFVAFFCKPSWFGMQATWLMMEVHWVWHLTKNSVLCLQSSSDIRQTQSYTDLHLCLQCWNSVALSADPTKLVFSQTTWQVATRSETYLD